MSITIWYDMHKRGERNTKYNLENVINWFPDEEFSEAGSPQDTTGDPENKMEISTEHPTGG